ncbi:MAG: type III-A CRISPR-associated RAMP protein Csm5 [Syntrophobacteraceae bacterium]|nr:type III-A CRISPR-associated RAMP protein Csm5 [Syntrophobacteraceae bacterium]
MREVMQKAMWVDLEVLTPIHIGNGTDISPIEYWIDEGFSRVNMGRLFEDPDFGPHQDAFIGGAASQRYLGAHLPTKLLSRHIKYRAPMSPEARKYLLRHPIQVKEQIKSAGRVFIPGSSIKGSLLSALISSTLEEKYRAEESRYSLERLIGDPRSFSNLLDVTIGSLGSQGSQGNGDKNRFHRWLDVSDSSLLSPEQALRIYYSEVVGARRGGLPILFEGLSPGRTFTFCLNTPSESRFNLSEMLKISDGFYKEVWTKSGIKEAPPENGYLLRIGQGSSAWATSLLIFAESTGARYEAVQRPKTRKLVDATIAMGWAVLTRSERSSLAQIPPGVETGSDREGQSMGATAARRGYPAAESLPEPVKAFEPLEPLLDTISTPETQMWRSVNLTWEPGSRTVVAKTAEGKAFTNDKAIIPEPIYDRLCVKRKVVKADIEVEPVGSRNFRIVSIGLESV